MLKISTAPHINSPQSTQSIMRDVIIALMPAFVVALCVFGVSALEVIITSVAGCVVFEYMICKYLMHIQPTTWDLSAVVTGLLLGYNLPAGFPIWMNLIGCFVAIAITKMAFGGIGKNLFNPALAGRVFLLISFPMEMTTWPKPHIFDFMNTDMQTDATTLGILKHLDAETSATALSRATTNQEQLPDYLDMFLGNIGGSIGEISTLALILGFIYLLYRRIISWHIPVYYIATFMILTTIHWLLTGSTQAEPMTQLLSGGLFLGAIFMATDYTTSPMSKQGRIIFAIGCGILTYVIRFYSVYPEGVSFAILIMNAFVPMIDNLCVPRVFGTRRK